MKKYGTGLIASICLLVLILDPKTAILGASDGLDLCIRTVIPSLFPFFVLSILLTASVSGSQSPLLRPLGKLCGIPEGGESILLIGFLGGYPTGAAAVAKGYEDGTLTRQEGRRMLAFCSNAGPSFIFGIVAAQLGNVKFGWILWVIHIISSIIVAATFPGKSNRQIPFSSRRPITLMESLEQSIRIMAKVCGWIVLFRVILAFLIRWFLWIMPKTVQIIIMGLLELTIGCTQLETIEIPEAFIITSALLAFGGLCILMQTISVTAKLGLGMYLSGKILQVLFSIFLSSLYTLIAFSYSVAIFPAVISLLVSIVSIYLINIKKDVAICHRILYNQSINNRLVINNAVPKEN